MFNVLTSCQAMQQMLINVSKNNTIHSLLQKQFPAIRSSDNKPTYYVTPKTIGYIHAIVTDGAGGRPKPKHFKRTMIADEEAAAGGEPIEAAAAEAGDNAPQPPQPPPPPAADDAAPDPAATPPPKKVVKGRGGSGGAKAQ